MKRANGRPAKRLGRPRSFDRDAALERAIEVFWRHGYEATSVSDLTAAMDINPPSLYAAFGDKEHLFLEAVERYQRRRGDTMRKVFSDAPTARAAIEQFLAVAAAELACSTHPRGCMLELSAATCSADSAHVHSVLAESRAAARSFLKTRIDRAVREGELPRGTDTAALTDFYTTVLQGMSIQAREGATRKSLLATAATAMRAWPAGGGPASRRRSTSAEKST